MTLQSLGWSAFFEAQLDNTPLRPCRILFRGVDLFLVHDGLREVFATVRKSLRTRLGVPPVVGDWVLVEPAGNDRCVIERVLDRRTAIARKAAGSSASPQVLAANVDRALLVTSMNQDFSVRRLERYLSLVWESGATPIIALTKADLVPDVGPFLREAEKCALGFPVLSISSISGTGLDELQSLLKPAETVVLLGSSGVGKSTLINLLSDSNLRQTKPIREKDGRGRHATSDRHLFPLHSGALLIDTPGLREVQLWTSDTSLDQAFPEISGLAANCRFRDCRHKGEPGCAVLTAIANGAIEPDRLRSFHRLHRELEHLDRQNDPLLAAKEKRKVKQIMRSYQKRYRFREEP